MPKQQASLAFSQNQEMKLTTKSKWPPARALLQTQQNAPERSPHGQKDTCLQPALIFEEM